MALSYATVSATALALLLSETTLAQTYRDTGGTVVPGAVPVSGDGSGPLFTSGNPGWVSGTLSATLGGFQPTPSYSTQSVAMTSAAHALPNGAVVIVYNTGSNPITIKLGGISVSVAAGQADIVPAGGWMAFTVGSATYYAVVGNGGMSSVVVSGGSGLPTGAGGGSGGTVVQGSAGSATGAWYVQPGTGAIFPVSGSVTATISGTPTIAGSVTANAGTNLNTSALATDAHLTALTSANHTDLAALATALGSPAQAGAPLAAGSNVIGGVTVAPSMSGGFSYKMASALTTAQTVKASAGQVVRAQCDNLAGSAAAYVEFFDATSVTLGTTAYVDYIPLAAGGTGGFTLSETGVQYSSGVMVAAVATLGASSAASTAVNCAFTYK